MSEEQIWFVLIFSIPFIPALVIFNVLPAGEMEGRAHGRFPFLGKLSIRMRGAVVAYVIICLIAVGAYWVITRTIMVKVALVPDPVESTAEDRKWFHKISKDVQVRLQFAQNSEWISNFFHRVAT